MWKPFGVISSRKKIVPSFSSLVKPNRAIYFMANHPHLYKNIRSSLLANDYFKIPSKLQQKYFLPSNKVSSSHIRDLQERRRVETCIKVDSSKSWDGHFHKTKVDPAHKLFSSWCELCSWIPCRSIWEWVFPNLSKKNQIIYFVRASSEPL